MSDTEAETRQPDSLPTSQEHADKDDDMSSSSSSDSERSSTPERNASLRTILSPYALRMLHLCKEIAVMLLVALTYAAITTDPPKVTKSPAAFPFFPQGSVVKDWYRGQISAAIERARTSDLAFVMFYAPWDAECQVVRGRFEETARVMKEQASFAAVNCWQPGGECRNHYNKVYFWPVLIVYPAHTRGVQYNGPYQVHHMVRFLNSVSKPLLRVTSAEELDELLINYDAVIVGHVNALPKSADYGVLYTTALRLLEKDPHQEIAFAVETHSNPLVTPKLELHLWNETWAYPKDMEWHPDKILTWIFKKLHQVTMWSFPPGMKSREFLVHLQQRPALVLFTPKNPLRLHTDFYSMLRQVGFEYYNCDNVEPIGYWKQLFKKKRYENYQSHNDLRRSCALDKDKWAQRHQDGPLVVTYSLAKQWANNSCCLKNSKCVCGNVGHLTAKPRECGKPGNGMFADDGMSSEGCLGGEEFGSAEASKSDDRYSPDSLLRAQRTERCRLAMIAEEYHPALFPEDITEYENASAADDGADINGLACKSNASIALLALDSLQYYHFAERLGVDVLKVKDKTAVVIVNEQAESHYVMSDPVTYTRLKDFIVNFTQSGLARTMQSHAIPSYTHVFAEVAHCAKGECVAELNSETFLPTVMQRRKAFVVLYHSKQCFFCKGVAHVFLSLARILSSVTSLQFLSIDGDLNTLPWQFTMDSYPTILFFPAEKKADSRVFPRTLPMTVQNLLNFVIVNLDPTLKLQAMWVLCNRTKFVEDRGACVKSVRTETLTVIESSLREWRNTVACARAEVLRRLQLLRQLHLLLAHPPHTYETVRGLMRKLKGMRGSVKGECEL